MSLKMFFSLSRVSVFDSCDSSATATIALDKQEQWRMRTRRLHEFGTAKVTYMMKIANWVRRLQQENVQISELDIVYLKAIFISIVGD